MIFRSAAVSLAAAAVFLAYGYYNAGRIVVTPYEIALERGSPEGGNGTEKGRDLRIALISDVHIGAPGSEKRFKKTVDTINSLDPDVVFIAGDFFDNDFSKIKDVCGVIGELKGIRSKYGIYACPGNHDSIKIYDEMSEFYKEAGVVFLRERISEIGNIAAVAGRCDKSPIGTGSRDSRAALGRTDMRQMLNEAYEGALPLIVLDHNPAHIDEYDNSADLILCGHTHAGQLFPANIVTGKMYTVDYGYYRKDDHSPQVIVSSGAGIWGMPVRASRHCEVVCIDLKIG